MSCAGSAGSVVVAFGPPPRWGFRVPSPTPALGAFFTMDRSSASPPPLVDRSPPPHPSPSRGRVCKAGRALLLQLLVALRGTRDEHLLECGNPLSEIHVRVIGHDFVPPRCARRYAAASGPASKSVKRIGFARCSVYPRSAASRLEAPWKVSWADP